MKIGRKNQAGKRCHSQMQSLEIRKAAKLREIVTDAVRRDVAFRLKVVAALRKITGSEVQRLQMVQRELLVREARQTKLPKIQKFGLGNCLLGDALACDVDAFAYNQQSQKMPAKILHVHGECVNKHRRLPA